MDLLEIPTRGVNHERLAKGDDTLLGSGDGALQDEEIVLDDTVVGEATHGRDLLVGDIRLGRGVSVVLSGADAVDLLVELITVVVTVLTSTCDGEHDLRRMPCTDTSDLAETLVGLARQLLGTPTVGNTLKSVTLRYGNDIDDLILLENGADGYRLLEETMGEVDLIGNRTTIDLNLHEMCLLLAETGLADLSVGKDADNSAVLADTLELTGDGLATVLGVLLGVAGEGLLLRAVPVLVEPTLDLVGKVGCPDGGEGAETARCLDVADNTNDHHWWCLDDGNSLDDFTLVHLCRQVIKMSMHY